MSIPRLTLCREKLAVFGGHVRDGGSSLSRSATLAVPRITQAGSPVIHTPDKSGLPFAILGAGAARSISPPDVRGARGLGYANHCAPDSVAPAPTPTISSAATTVHVAASFP